VAKNRSFKRDSQGNLVSEVSKREKRKWKHLRYFSKNNLTIKIKTP
jgi:hypothetical protein